MWFETLTGFSEKDPSQVRSNMIVEGETLASRVNGRSWRCGKLETPSLGELRDRVFGVRYKPGSLSVQELVGDVQHLHAHEANAGALFQVASQFNLLEMASPDVTPEHGVGIYEHDHTQGPACAIAAGAGTIYRNYFAVVNGQVGQTSQNQIDCLSDIGAELGNDGQRFWMMKNGYVLPTYDGLVEIGNRLRAAPEQDLDQIRQLLRIGVQWNTQVTLGGSTHLVSQAYCSALPVAYSRHPADLWQDFAQVILDAAYEATMCVAALNSLETGNQTVFLTLLGGGAFGNHPEWIIGSMKRALEIFRDWDLRVVIVSYGHSRQEVQTLVDYFRN